jgi:hypothetical protein
MFTLALVATDKCHGFPDMASKRDGRKSIEIAVGFYRPLVYHNSVPMLANRSYLTSFTLFYPLSVITPILCSVLDVLLGGVTG